MQSQVLKARKGRPQYSTANSTGLVYHFPVYGTGPHWVWFMASLPCILWQINIFMFTGMYSTLIMIHIMIHINIWLHFIFHNYFSPQSEKMVNTILLSRGFINLFDCHKFLMFSAMTWLLKVLLYWSSHKYISHRYFFYTFLASEMCGLWWQGRNKELHGESKRK